MENPSRARYALDSAYPHRRIFAMSNTTTPSVRSVACGLPSTLKRPLDRADELHGKIIAFTARPPPFRIGTFFPTKVRSIRIFANPFDDIVLPYHCCCSAAEKRAQQRAREEAQREREGAERRKGAKNAPFFALPPCRLPVTGMCSSSVRDEEAAPPTVAKKAIFRHDLVDPQAAVVPLPDLVNKPSGIDG
ncbi:hypothetical protein FB45DRAFT_1039316 [Roridomyces roridus]|uniref:Uncharacterized protein n=1 Tax=Roridomyces roridus TaxID=1738132 RepID=A0AAD7B3S8_9AGAR|nr:hypothetical protein FB45DRAFT_1039316 [Roridomyces roridus]